MCNLQYNEHNYLFICIMYIVYKFGMIEHVEIDAYIKVLVLMNGIKLGLYQIFQSTHDAL